MDSFESDFFSGVELEHIEFDILSDQWQALQAEIAENEWSIDEGLRYILAAGLAVIQNQQTWEDVESGRSDLARELRGMQSERMARVIKRELYASFAYRFLHSFVSLVPFLRYFRRDLPLNGLGSAAATGRARPHSHYRTISGKTRKRTHAEGGQVEPMLGRYHLWPRQSVKAQFGFLGLLSFTACTLPAVGYLMG